MADIPVYLIAGFLDGGKTDFINGILEDGFAREDKTLLICCEEGELEYEQKALDNVTVVTVDEETALTCSQCKEWEKQYKPKQVLIEYNGMWSMERLYREVLPANWVLYQVMTFVDANTFETYAKNMGQIMMEKITNADLLVFNRCTDELKAALRKRNLRMVNRRADIYLENEDGTTSETKTTGVYCVMGREAAFKPVSVLYSNENFALVKAEISSNQELLRLRPGDEVIVKAYDLYDGKVVGE